MTDKNPTLVNVNEASMEELVAISGIGNNLAKKIIDQRPFSSLGDLVSIQGINETKLATLLPFLTLDKPKSQAITRTKPSSETKTRKEKPVTELGTTEAFVFLEDKNERQDALLIILGGFILGLIILFLRPSRN
jgi:hypothetical protein